MSQRPRLEAVRGPVSAGPLYCESLRKFMLVKTSLISLKRLLFVVSIIGIVSSSTIIFFPIFDSSAYGSYIELIPPASSQVQLNSISNNSAAAISIKNFEKQVGLGLPTRLKIPKISVDAAVEYVGLTSRGAVGVPKDFTNVAWLNLWPRPGDNGSAIITGHYGRKGGKASVFDNLYKLRPGDKLYIEDDRGLVTSFVVRESRRYDPQADASEVFGLSDGKAHLNLITCEGVWNKTQKSYSKRLVVFTDKE